MKSEATSSARSRTRVVAEAIAIVLGAACLVWAWRADLRWCERHIMTCYWAFAPDLVERARTWRLCGIALGFVFLAVVRPLVGRWAGKRSGKEAIGTSARFAVAIALSLVVSEIGLRLLNLPRPAAKPDIAAEVRMGQPDARYGWTWLASQTRTMPAADRVLHYAFNADKNRAASQESLPDLSAPTLLFTGESIMVGFGLEWDETCGAIVGRATDLQVVNLAVNGYGNDQSLLRLADALPKFARPVVVVTLYMPSILYRLSADDHPHLTFDGDAFGLSSGDFFDDLRLFKLWRNIVPYHGGGELELAAKIFKATDRLARARGAKAIFVGPRFDQPRGDQYVIDELFLHQGLTFVDIDIGGDVIPGNGHPTAPEIHKMADAVIVALRAAGVAE